MDKLLIEVNTIMDNFTIKVNNNMVTEYISQVIIIIKVIIIAIIRLMDIIVNMFVVNIKGNFNLSIDIIYFRFIMEFQANTNHPNLN